ncbi:MAG: tetratricopeptide repeat protein [Sedimentisphaerales bacterium]|nr:tetratricopeptide repeat protein [Sedimentisphaerales bacterium]
MSQLLEILGEAITIDTTELIWHWLNAVMPPLDENKRKYEQLNRAIELLSIQKTCAASEQLRFYLFENPTCTYGLILSAAIYIQNNQILNALEELNSVYKREPNNTMALYTLGYCHERLGRVDKAVEFYQDCLKFKNYLQLPAQRLAAIYLKNNQLEKAIEQYHLLKSEYPDDISTLLNLGHLYLSTGRFHDAIETFNAAILMHPDNYFHQDEETEQLIAEGNFYDALDHIEDLLQDHPYRADLLMKHGDVLRAMGATTDAISEYENAVRICPDLLEATIKLGTQYLQVQQEELAAEQFNRAFELNDNIVDAYIGLSISQKYAGFIDESLTTLSLASSISPNSSLLFAEIASIHFRLSLKNSHSFFNDTPEDMTQAVINAHRQQISQRPQNPDLYYRLGILMMNIKRFEDAIKLFENALELNPLFSRARSKLSICLLQVNRISEAINSISFLTNYNNETLELHYKTALLYCDKIKFASSMLNLEQKLAKSYASPEASANISIVLQNLGLLDRRAAMWDNLVETASLATNSYYQF